MPTLKHGCWICVDSGFVCLPANTVHKVFKNDIAGQKEFYLYCNRGRHYIEDNQSGFVVIGDVNARTEKMSQV